MDKNILKKKDAGKSILPNKQNNAIKFLIQYRIHNFRNNFF